MINPIPSTVVNRRRERRVRSWRNPSSDATYKFFLVVAGLFVAGTSICNNNNGSSGTIFVVDAIAPPHPEVLEESRKHRELYASLFPNTTYFSLPTLPSGIWEPASDFRKRRRLHGMAEDDDDFDGDDLCRYLNSHECQEIEDSFQGMAVKTRSNIVRWGGNGNDDTSLVGLHKFSAESGNGIQETEPYTIRTLVILITWKGHEERRDWISREQIDRLWNGEGADDIIPTGSIKNYTARQSYGTVNLVADVIDWQVTDNTEAHYADGRSAMPQNGDREPHLREAFQFVLNKMDDDNFPWEEYDSDNDGIIDHVQFLHSGYGAESGGYDCYTSAKAENRIWAHALPEGRGKWTSAKTGKALGAFSVASALVGNCDREVAQLGIAMHEFYHTLGLPDLYDKEQPYAGTRGGLGGLGVFCMMASPFGANNNEMYPGSLSPWSKLEMGFLKEPIEITKSGTYEARPSNDYPDIYSIRRGYPDGEMLLLENRQPSGWDSSLWTGGILIYKIDETQNHNGNKNHGFPGQTDAPEPGQSWPSNGLHFPIALLQADGKYDLELARNNGDAGDFFNEPNQKLEPGNGELVATDKGTYPNTDSYALGDIKTTGITIDNFRETPKGSGVFTFRVTFDDDSAQLPPTTPPSNVPTKLPTKTPTKKPTDQPSRVKTTPPTDKPTQTLTKAPTNLPTKAPTTPQTNKPTNVPTKLPTNVPSKRPTTDPSQRPTNLPKEAQVPPARITNAPTKAPTGTPTLSPTDSPTKLPTGAPTKPPTDEPTKSPTGFPTKSPTTMPTDVPTKTPTVSPTTTPTIQPIPTEVPTTAPTKARASLAPIDVSECGRIIQVNITTDNRPEETTWEIVSAKTGNFLTGYRSSEDLRPKRSLRTYTEYSWKICTSGSETSFLFRLYDTGHNGIHSPGKYSLSVDGKLIEVGGPFAGDSITVEFSTADDE